MVQLFPVATSHGSWQEFQSFCDPQEMSECRAQSCSTLHPLELPKTPQWLFQGTPCPPPQTIIFLCMFLLVPSPKSSSHALICLPFAHPHTLWGSRLIFLQHILPGESSPGSCWAGEGSFGCIHAVFGMKIKVS